MLLPFVAVVKNHTVKTILIIRVFLITPVPQLLILRSKIKNKCIRITPIYMKIQDVLVQDIIKLQLKNLEEILKTLLTVITFIRHVFIS